MDIEELEAVLRVRGARRYKDTRTLVFKGIYICNIDLEHRRMQRGENMDLRVDKLLTRIDRVGRADASYLYDDIW